MLPTGCLFICFLKNANLRDYLRDKQEVVLFKVPETKA